MRKEMRKPHFFLMEVLVDALVVLRGADVKPVVVFNLIAAHPHASRNELEIDGNNIDIAVGRNLP